jgi:paraquat-inducible protein B
VTQRANPKWIGAFVLGAVALVVIGVLLLGGAKFLTEKRTFVAYFEGSVKGLNIGAPVEFQGVRIGSVTDIQLQFLTEDLELRIPVFLQFEPGKISQVGAHVDPQQRFLKPLVERGLRAQLEMQSIVTGQLIVQLGFHPDTPIRLVGDGKIPEVPDGAHRDAGAHPERHASLDGYPAAADSATHRSARALG